MDDSFRTVILEYIYTIIVNAAVHENTLLVIHGMFDGLIKSGFKDIKTHSI